MLDSQLQTVIQASLIAGLAARGIAAGVMQNNQPRQFAAPSTPTVFHTLQPRKQYGWPSYKEVWNVSTQKFDRTRTQVVHSRFQIAGCAPGSPATPNALTSGDLAQVAIQILQDEDFIASIVAQQFNVFRVTELPVFWFQDSNGQNVEWCPFDIIFTHNDVFVSSVGPIKDFVGTYDSV